MRFLKKAKIIFFVMYRKWFREYVADHPIAIGFEIFPLSLRDETSFPTGQRNHFHFKSLFLIIIPEESSKTNANESHFFSHGYGFVCQQR